MPTLSFEGETNGEILIKVRRWLASVDGTEQGNISAVQAVSQGAELTKEALRIIAGAIVQVVLYVCVRQKVRRVVDLLDGHEEARDY